MADCRPLLNEGLAEIQPAVTQAAHLSVFLDFDGTLASIVDDPSKAELDRGARRLLKDVASRTDVMVAVISGRALSDLQTRVGLKQLVYAGNHGLEICGPGLRFVEPFAAARQQLLARISSCLKETLSGIPGVRVEYKGLTTSVHYRQAPPANARDIERIVEVVVAPSVSPFFLDAGQMVLEIMPRNEWHKGAAVCWINSRTAGRGALSIYIGAERTSETAFRQLSDGITVCVGEALWTSARFYLPDPGGVREFLAWLIKNRHRPSMAA